MAAKRCGELTINLNSRGEPCRAFARTKEGKDTCLAHASELERAEAGFTSSSSPAAPVSATGATGAINHSEPPISHLQGSPTRALPIGEGIEVGEVIRFDFGRTDAVLTKAQFARHADVRRSTRWVEQRVNEGMPSHMDGNRRMFPLDDCLAWLGRWREERGAA